MEDQLGNASAQGLKVSIAGDGRLRRREDGVARLMGVAGLTWCNVQLLHTYGAVPGIGLRPSQRGGAVLVHR